MKTGPAREPTEPSVRAAIAARGGEASTRCDSRTAAARHLRRLLQSMTAIEARPVLETDSTLDGIEVIYLDL